MFDNSCCFEPTFTLNGIPILARRCQAIIAQWKAEALFAVTHLALLGVKKQEAAFWGYNKCAYTEEERAVLLGCSFKIMQIGEKNDWVRIS